MTESYDAQLRPGADLPVASLAGGTVEWIAPDAPFVEATQRLSDGSIGALVVGDGVEPKGIFTERDVVHVVADGRDQATTTVADVMSTDLRWCDASAAAGEVADEMMTHYVRHLLIEDDGALAGIISIRDLLGALTPTEA